MKIMKSIPILLAVLALHLLGFWQVMQLTPPKPMPKQLKPIMVSLITPPAVLKIPKKIKQVKKLKQKRKKSVLKRKITKKIVTLPVKTRRKVKSTPKQYKRTHHQKSKIKVATLRQKVEATPTVTPKQYQRTHYQKSKIKVATLRQKVEATPTDKPKQYQRTHYSKIKAPVTIPPSYQYNPHPPYPRLSRRRGEEGIVLLKLKVNKKGSVELIKIKKTSGFSRLDKAAIHQVQSKWRFIPAKKEGQRVTAWVTVPIVFKLM